MSDINASTGPGASQLTPQRANGAGATGAAGNTTTEAAQDMQSVLEKLSEDLNQGLDRDAKKTDDSFLEIHKEIFPPTK